MPKVRPRDERGWMIPREGTISRRIYDLLVAGKTRADIARDLKDEFPQKDIYLRVYNIQNPDTANERRRVQHTRSSMPPIGQSVSLHEIERRINACLCALDAGVSQKLVKQLSEELDALIMERAKRMFDQWLATRSTDLYSPKDIERLRASFYRGLRSRESLDDCLRAAFGEAKAEMYNKQSRIVTELSKATRRVARLRH